MSMEAIETIETDLGTLRIFRDEDAESPFEMYDNLGTIYHWHRRYNLGTEVRDEEEIPKGIRLPVYLYDHSGITLNTSGFSCGWDSGQVGWIVAEFDKVREQYNCKGINPATRKKVLKVLKAEVETYARFLEGQVYGYILTAPPPSPCGECGKPHEPEEVDSCWGFIGHLDDNMIEDMLGNSGAKRIEVAA